MGMAYLRFKTACTTFQTEIIKDSFQDKKRMLTFLNYRFYSETTITFTVKKIK